MHLPVSEPFLNTNENENQAREGGGDRGVLHISAIGNKNFSTKV